MTISSGKKRSGIGRRSKVALSVAAALAGTAVVFAAPVDPLSEIQENWFEHREIISLMHSDDQVAVYFDSEVDPDNTWMNEYLSEAWAYTKKVYGAFGEEGTDESRLYAVFHRNKHGGGHPSNYFRESHGFRNMIDVGSGPWDCMCGTQLDLVTHEIAHIVEFASRGVKGSPSFKLWGDSKWAEIYQYDVYDALGMDEERDRWNEQMMSSTEDFPRPGTNWYKDFWMPLYENYGGSEVLANYFEVLAENFVQREIDYNGKEGRNFARDLNWGEFFHFWSAAAGEDIRPIAEQAFGWPDEYESQFLQAQSDFPLVYGADGDGRWRWRWRWRWRRERSAERGNRASGGEHGSRGRHGYRR